ncbi:glycosyltransferase family 8 protein [Cohnella cellulosilytica]|uniref:Glycosyltransferase family 8 protein n=1 Tax=Cohnella cellulosilytica TaxID=986710 RepID=A0ABW2FN62_9BACL
MAASLNEIAIAAAADEGYAQHLAAALVSAAVHLPPPARACFYIVDGGLSAVSRELLEATVSDRRVRIRWIRMTPGRLDGIRVGGHLSPATYCKILVPELLRRYSIDKVLYLDCDVIVLGDLTPIWQEDLRGYALAAIEDIGGQCRKKALAIPSSSPYFNAGVLLFNLRRWREEHLTDRVLAYAAEHGERLLFHDQDALNAVLHGEWLELPPEWNLQSNMLTANARKAGSEEPIVVHYTGVSKPWHYDNVHPYRSEYYHYLNLTAWRRYRPPVTLGGLAKKAVKRALPGAALDWVRREKDRWAQGMK